MSKNKRSKKAGVTTAPAGQRRSPATKLFLGTLASVAAFYAVVMAYHVSHPVATAATSEPTWLEQCRQLCAQYGLVSTGNVKADAETYLEAVASKKLSAPLEQLLVEDGFERAVTEEHPLVGRPAPDFMLVNSEDEQISLADLNRNGPVVLVFYYGYGCSHCVAQLFALQKDLDHFHELGAEVVAISADTPKHTRAKYAEYGGFSFPVLSDPEYTVSEVWGVYDRPSADQSEALLHGTFVIDRDGQVVFADRGYQPFVDNRSLLQWVKAAASEI